MGAAERLQTFGNEMPGVFCRGCSDTAPRFSDTKREQREPQSLDLPHRRQKQPMVPA